MCWNCCDCISLSKPGEPIHMICVGFKGKRPVVAKNGHLTENYRWCSHWTLEKIKECEMKLLKERGIV